jgi:hypothetical protein
MDLDYVVVPALILLIGILVIWLSIRRLLSLSAKVSGRCRRIAERIVLPVIVLVVGGIAASAIFNAIALHWFRAHNPPPGEIYIVDGHKMRMYCTGSGTHHCPRSRPGRRRIRLERCAAGAFQDHPRLRL